MHQPASTAPGPIDGWLDLSSALARLWAARDPHDVAEAAARAALGLPGVVGARFAAQGGGPLDPVAEAGAWNPSRPRRSGWRNREVSTVEDRSVRDTDGTVLGTLSVQTDPDEEPPAHLGPLLDTLAAQIGHVLVQLGRAERLGRFQQQFLTERARAVHNEGLWQVAFDEAPIGMAMVSLAAGRVGEVLKVNDTLCRMTRRPASQLRATALPDLIVTEDAAPLSSVLARAVGGRRTSATLALRLRTGGNGAGAVAARITTSPVFDDDGKAVAAICHIEDLTERENARDEPGTRRDPRSGLLTRSSFADALGRIHHRALRANVSTGVLLCDLSLVHAKAADLDSQAAAELRDELSRQVQSVLRPDDAVGQLDATTIGVALAELSSADAEAIAGRIHAAIARTLEAHNLRVDDVPRGGDEPISIAMIDPGVALGGETESFVQRAHAALRGAGRAGDAVRYGTQPDPAGTRIVLWQRPRGATPPPAQSSRITLWRRDQQS